MNRALLLIGILFSPDSPIGVGLAGAASELPPGSWVSPEAVARFRVANDARSRGEDNTAPDKLEDQWTISRALRHDLADQFSGFGANFTVLEVGSYFGYTTRLLSDYFSRVIALDAVPQFLQANREYNLDRNNILYLKFHTLDDDWGIFSLNTVHVVFLDASHDFETVMLDIENCLKLPTVSLIIFDDYGAEIGVRAAVHEFVARGRLQPVVFLGEGADGKPWRLSDGREVEHREAIACEVVRHVQAEPASGAQPEESPQEPPPADVPPPEELPGPGEAVGQTGALEERQIKVGGTPVKLDKLGPVVVNVDGSMSRIKNWHEMIEAERQTTVRRISKRNQQRLAKLQAQGGAGAKAAEAAAAAVAAAADAPAASEGEAR